MFSVFSSPSLILFSSFLFLGFLLFWFLHFYLFPLVTSSARRLVLPPYFPFCVAHRHPPRVSVYSPFTTSRSRCLPRVSLCSPFAFVSLFSFRFCVSVFLFVHLFICSPLRPPRPHAGFLYLLAVLRGPIFAPSDQPPRVSLFILYLSSFSFFWFFLPYYLCTCT